jgi:hypothetical protein
MDIVLQGSCSDITLYIIEEYKKLSFVDNIILSSYEDTICFDIPKHVVFLQNDIVKPMGLGNRNLQINTSRNGLSKVTSDNCIKMRTDQYIRPHSMEMMYDYWIRNRADYKVFVLGMYRAFPYHPRDHVFWGRTEDVKTIFDIPFDIDRGSLQNYNYNTRAETYIGQYYYARFDNSIYEHISKPEIFLTDLAPKKQEALEKDFSLRDRLFRPFPRISMAWPKHNLTEYHYHLGQQFTEYWGDE